MRIIRTQGRTAKKSAELLAKLEHRGGSSLETVLPAVRKILREVREDGDKALIRFAQKFDGLEGKNAEALRVSPEETAAAWKQINPTLKQALEIAAANIR